ncbi:hypothetical protein TNCV_2771161 [Trichonephila clavipes]|nr:hypothetical protein TNCV_2771161 [Trichonephila clavipes]
MILLQDNVPSHIAKPVKDISNYHNSASMGYTLAKQHFSNFEKVGKWLDKWYAKTEPMVTGSILRICASLQGLRNGGGLCSPK